MVALAVVPYLNTLGAGFTFDDFGLVVGNPAVPAGTPLWRVFVVENVPGGGGAYRPLTILTYLANAVLGGGTAAYHGVNVVLHAAVSVLVFL